MEFVGALLFLNFFLNSLRPSQTLAGRPATEFSHRLGSAYSSAGVYPQTTAAG